MDLRITARHFELTTEIRDYAERKVQPLAKFDNNIVDALLVLTKEKHRLGAEMTFSLAGKKIFAHTETDDVFATIDDVMHKAERMLRDHHDKSKDYKKSDAAVAEDDTEEQVA